VSSNPEPLFFSIFIYQKNKTPIFLDILVIFSSFIFFILSVFTPFIIKDVSLEQWGVNTIFGDLALIFFIGIIILTFLVVILLVKGYRFSSLEEKARVNYFLIGAFIFILMNLIFNIVFPLMGTYKYYQFGDYAALPLFMLIAYAIVKREFFGIRVILTQALVFVIAILLLLQAVSAQDLLEFSWKVVLFLVFSYFGYLLIQSVVREIKQKAELQRLYEEVDRLSRAKSEFLSIASHQLRTPLTAIKGYISMLLEGTYGQVKGKPRPPLEKVYQSNERLIDLINDLLNISRIESGTLKIEARKVSLESMISSLIDEMKIKADQRKLYIKWEKLASLPEISADAGKLRQVILNIIDNCIKYTDQGGITIKSGLNSVSSKYPNGSILIQVLDTGAGMTQEEIKKMFESFTRGEAGEKKDTSGLGLGLYIAKKFSELHGGRVWAESEGKGKGSKFFIELPIK